MSDVLVGALSLLLATNKATALTNLVAERTGWVEPVAATNDPVAMEALGRAFNGSIANVRFEFAHPDAPVGPVRR